MNLPEFIAYHNALRQAELEALRDANAELRRLKLALTAPPTDHNHTRAVTADQVVQAVRDCYGDKQAAANLLGIPLPAVYRRLAAVPEQKLNTQTQ